MPIDQVLQHCFVGPSLPLFGKVGAKASLDGWRDDKFPRLLDYSASSLKIIEALVVEGKALGYFPVYYCEGLPVEFLKIVGCPYTCAQKIRLVANRPHESGWMNQVF
ncbi:MAG: hypothetical protein R3C68_10625 [Myxococcota bacterium]